MTETPLKPLDTSRVASLIAFLWQEHSGGHVNDEITRDELLAALTELTARRKNAVLPEGDLAVPGWHILILNGEPVALDDPDQLFWWEPYALGSFPTEGAWIPSMEVPQWREGIAKGGKPHDFNAFDVTAREPVSMAEDGWSYVHASPGPKTPKTPQLPEGPKTRRATRH